MENNTLIRKIHMDCPLCDKTHEVTSFLEVRKTCIIWKICFCAKTKEHDGISS